MTDGLRRSLRVAGLASALLLALAGAASAHLHAKGHLTVDGKPYRVHVNGSDVTLSPDVSGDAGDSIDADTGTVKIDGEGDRVRLFSDAEVLPGQHVDGDVVAVFGSVHVAGEVSGSAIAVFGSVQVDSGATIGSDAVAVGGGLDARQGSHIAGQSVSIGFGLLPLTFGLPALPMILAFLALGWIITLFFGWLLVLLFPDRLQRVAQMASHRTAASLALGVVSGPMVPVLAVLLMVTVIGLPIGLMLPLVYLAVVYAGFIAATYVLGAKLLRRRLDEAGGLAPVAAGALFVTFFFALGAVLWLTPGAVRTVALFFLLVGVLMLLGLSAIGTGAFLLARGGSRGKDAAQPAPGVPPAPGAPPAAAPQVTPAG